MSQEEIRKKREEIERRLKAAKARVEIIRCEWHQLHIVCEHPDKFVYYAQGDRGWSCPDCGWGT